MSKFEELQKLETAMWIGGSAREGQQSPWTAAWPNFEGASLWKWCSRSVILIYLKNSCFLFFNKSPYQCNSTDYSIRKSFTFEIESSEKWVKIDFSPLITALYMYHLLRINFNFFIKIFCFGTITIIEFLIYFTNFIVLLILFTLI